MMRMSSVTTHSSESAFSDGATCKRFAVTITYRGRPYYTVSIMEFENGKVVHETQYFADPFEAPSWRSQWVERAPPI